MPEPILPPRPSEVARMTTAPLRGAVPVERRFHGGGRLEMVDLGLQAGVPVPANAWAPVGADVNAVARGHVSSENTAPLRADRNRGPAVVARHPQGDWAAPAVIAAGACEYLASPDAGSVNGAILNVDGGWLGR